ncbi:MAG: DUF2283 domain-containing protein [Gemmatimonadota bacterium]|nr:DUF2283 domain-containing protein [Gemmatimonadota bacterium]
MKITYDPKADALYIALWGAKAPFRTVDAGRGVHLDFNDSGKLAGLELLGASEHLPADDLARIGKPSMPRTLGELEKETGITAETWKKLCQAKRVPATKRGRDWVVELADALNYMESRAPSGRPARRRKARRALTR